jgi:hypothetical protein
MLGLPNARLACLFVILASAMPMAKRMPPPTKEALVGPWVGLSEDETYAFRLELKLDGGGRLGYLFAEEEPKILPIASWAISGREIEMSIAPTEPNAPGAISTAKGHATTFALSLTIGGTGWKRRVELRREHDIERKWNLLRQGMSDRRS